MEIVHVKLQINPQIKSMICPVKTRANTIFPGKGEKNHRNQVQHGKHKNVRGQKRKSEKGPHV